MKKARTPKIYKCEEVNPIFETKEEEERNMKEVIKSLAMLNYTWEQQGLIKSDNKKQQ